MNEAKLLEAMRRAQPVTGSGEGLTTREIAELMGHTTVGGARRLIREGLAAGRLRRTVRFQTAIDGRLVPIPTFVSA